MYIKNTNDVELLSLQIHIKPALDYTLLFAYRIHMQLLAALVDLTELVVINIFDQFMIKRKYFFVLRFTYFNN